MWVIEKRLNSGSDWHDSHTSYKYIQPSEEKFGWDTKEDAVKKLRDFFKTERVLLSGKAGQKYSLHLYTILIMNG